MVTRKYTGDYKVEYDSGRNGRIKQRAYYVGDHYGFKAGAERLKRTKRDFSILIPLAWAAFLALLIFRSGFAKIYYIIIPQVCTLIPLCYMTMALWRLLKKAPPFTREDSDKVYARLAASSLFTLIFSAIAAAGCIVRFAAFSEALSLPGDIAYGLCALAEFLSALCVYIRRKEAETKIVKRRDNK